MKNVTIFLGIVVLVAAVARPGMARDTGVKEGLLVEDSTTSQETLPKSVLALGDIYQDMFLMNIQIDNQALSEKMANRMDVLLVKSFSDRMVQLIFIRECSNAEIAGLKLLQARLSFDLIQHGMAKKAVEMVDKEFEKSPEEIDVGLILNTVLRAYPKELDFILPICSAQVGLGKHYGI